MRKDRLIVVAFVFFLVALVLAIFVGAFVWGYAFSKLYSGKEECEKQEKNVQCHAM